MERNINSGVSCAGERNTVREKLFRWCAIAVVAVCVLAFLSFEVSSKGAEVFFYRADGNLMLYSIVFVALCFFFSKADRLCLVGGYTVLQTVLQSLIAAFFSAFTIISVIFESDHYAGFRVLLGKTFSILSIGLAFVGGVMCFVIIIRMIWNLGEYRDRIKIKSCGWLDRFFGEHLWRNCMLVMGICWLPQYLIRFPGAVPYDVWQSLAMHLGYTETTTQHPLIWGSLFGTLTELGMSIGVNWLSVFVICLIQHLLCMLVVSYAVSTVKRLGYGGWFLLGVLVFFTVLPAISLYASTVYNDIWYGLAIMLLTTELVYYLYEREEYFSRPRHYVLTAVAVFGTAFRYNGFYTMLVLIAAVMCRELYLLLKRKGCLRQAAALVLLLLMLPLACGQAVQSTLNNVYDAKAITSRAMLAMPIQQSVRCLVQYGEDIPKEDYDALHAVLTWSDGEYAEKYNPKNFDGVKESFKTDATKDELAGFIKAWLRLVVRYPHTCFLATAEQTYYLFSPRAYNVRYYESMGAHTELALVNHGLDTSPFVIEYPGQRALCRLFMSVQDVYFPRTPVLGLTVNMSAYVILLFSVCLSLLFRKDKRPLLLAAALLVTLGITVLGPAVYMHPRYIYPIMYCMPILIAAFTSAETKSRSMESFV